MLTTSLPSQSQAMRFHPGLLERLDPADAAALLASAVEKSAPAGRILYHQGDAADRLFIVKAGAVKVFWRHSNGNARTTSYYHQGMLVGAHDCEESWGNHMWSAQALVDCTLLWIRRADYLDLIERSPRALRCALAVSEFKSKLLQCVIRILTEPALERRIAMTVQHIGMLCGVDRGGEVEIDRHVTHQEIAEMAGVSRQSVTKLLTCLERAGRIRRQGRKLFVAKGANDSPAPSALGPRDGDGWMESGLRRHTRSPSRRPRPSRRRHPMEWEADRLKVPDA